MHPQKKSRRPGKGLSLSHDGLPTLHHSLIHVFTRLIARYQVGSPTCPTIHQLPFSRIFQFTSFTVGLA
ncbi:hypothetical protein Lal_00025847 [Lupinus albus]|nr:hypothetical protein Lal_00025847 [Lupinus albus]